MDSKRSRGKGTHDSQNPSGRISRRQVLGTLLSTGVAGGCSGELEGSLESHSSALLPARPSDSGIEHIIVVMMKNRSFDHYLGWVPGADGRQAGLTYPDRDGTLRETYPLAPDFRGCAHPDPDHSYTGGRIEYNEGACDGWLRAGLNDEYAIGYYRQQDLRFHGQAVPRWTTFDRYFSAIMAETYPNRIYQHAAQTDRIVNTLDICPLPTIWDRLAEAGLRGRYYYSDVPFLALWGAKYLPIARPFAAFLIDALLGTLPHVSFIDPAFLGAEQGLSSDDHPHGDIRRGQAFLNLIYSAVTRGPAWRKTVLVINYDEWGGFFDHVPPPTAPIPEADRVAGNVDGLLGFRTPTLLVAPWARPGFVSNTVFDHTSVLKMIEWRWGLEPLTVRDSQANNLAEALDFTQPVIKRPPLFAVPPGPVSLPCELTEALGKVSLDSLRELALRHGWPVY